MQFQVIYDIKGISKIEIVQCLFDDWVHLLLHRIGQECGLDERACFGLKERACLAHPCQAADQLFQQVFIRYFKLKGLT